ncbi:MAG TPA: hypothetical protein VMR02_09460 [Terracidiphilus sp.]|jgi:hypothetical protein|nr:hypothetical protein [Terracidiphilus sp.]
MTDTQDDSKLNRAALVIAKLLLLTREGKIEWANSGTLLTGDRYSAKLDGDIEAIVARNENSFGFSLSGPPAVKIPSAGLLDLIGSTRTNEILSISLHDAAGGGLVRTPESVVFRDLRELYRLASNPKSVSDDLRLKQVLSYLDKLGG